LISELAARERQADLAGTAIVAEYDPNQGAISSLEQNVMTKRRAGVFFSIYYCMTGVHAIHILGGIAVLVWLLVRSVREDFNRQYFGPVDYVGLYWHLVDLIWIYLFPLLYLIR
jgi:cytochrome c oxidase subunit 3